MRKHFLLYLFLLFISIDIFAGNIPFDNTNNYNFNYYKKKFRRKVFSANSFYIEAAGLAYKWSINYDRVASSTDNSLLTIRLGYGMYNDENGKSISKIPLTVNGLFGKKHYLEVGFGGVYSTTEYNSIVPAIDLGYRYQNPKGGIVIRVTATATYEAYYHPVSHRELYRTIIPYGGISLGYNF